MHLIARIVALMHANEAPAETCRRFGLVTSTAESSV